MVRQALLGFALQRSTIMHKQLRHPAKRQGIAPSKARQTAERLHPVGIGSSSLYANQFRQVEIIPTRIHCILKADTRHHRDVSMTQVAQYALKGHGANHPINLLRQRTGKALMIIADELQSTALHRCNEEARR